MADLANSLDQLQISIDGLTSIGDSIASSLASTIGGFNSSFDAVASNLTNQIAHLSEVAETVSANFATQLDQLIGVTEASFSNLTSQLAHLAAIAEAASTNLTVQVGALVATLAPGAFGPMAANLQQLPAAPVLHTLPAMDDLHATPQGQALNALPVNLPTAQLDQQKKPGGIDFAALFGGLKDSLAGLATIATQVGSRFGGLTAPFAVASGALSGLGSIVGGVAGPAFAAAGQAVSQLTQSFERVVGVMGQFAEVSSPAIVGEFNRALKDLQATVGAAFVPFFSAMTSITRQVAGELFPAMQALQPVFLGLAGIVGSVLVPVANAFGSVLQSLQPAFAALTEIIQTAASIFGAILAPVASILNVFVSLEAIWQTALSPFMKLIDLAAQLWATFNPMTVLLQGLATILGGVAQVFGALMTAIDPIFQVLQGLANEFRAIGILLGSFFSAAVKVIVDSLISLIPKLDLTDVLAGLHSAFLTVGKALIEFAVFIARLFGNNDFGKRVADSLRAQAGVPGKQFQTAAPQNVGISSLDSISKSMATASAQAIGAGGQPAKKDTADLLEELAKIAAKADNNTTVSFEKMQALLETANTIMGDVKIAMTDANIYLERVKYYTGVVADKGQQVQRAVGAGTGLAVAPIKFILNPIRSIAGG